MTAPNQATEELALVCRVRRVLAALPVGDLIETMRPLPVAPLGQTNAFVLGVAVIRGVPTPVVDPGALLDGTRVARPTRFVTTRAGTRTVALAVEEVLGMRRFAASTLHALPALVAETPMVGGLAAIDDGLVLWLRSARLVSDEVWARLDAARGRA